MAERRLILEPFHVEPHLVGRPLASPLRRILAHVVDAVLLVVPTVATAFGAAGLTLYLSDRPSFDALRHLDRLNAADGAAAKKEARDLARLLVRIEAPGVPAEMAVAVEKGEWDRAAEILKNVKDISIELGMEEGGEAPLPPSTIRLSVGKLIPRGLRALALLGVPALYFAAFARSRRGATPGKRLLGISIVRLDGEKLSWLEALERFVGYVHIPATAFISVLDLWRDPNRRLPHDRTVHTAVLRAGPAAAAETAVKPGAAVS